MDAEPPLDSFFGGFTRHFGTVHPRTQAVRLDVLPDRLRLGPKSRSRIASVLFREREARYNDLKPVRVIRRPISLVILFERSDGEVYRFRPGTDDLMQDAAEPVIAALRQAGAPIAD